jgi:prepilin-type processing-associated H-X9-DG protein
MWLIVLIAGGALMAFMAFIGILIALLLPAVQQAREAARRTQCKNNLKQIGLALHNYHDTYNSFPPAYVADSDGRPMHSWRVLILPYLDQQALYQSYDFTQPWDSPANQFVLQSMPPVFACPSNPAQGGNTTAYAAAFGPDCVFSGPEGVKIQTIVDGTSNTVMVGEATRAAIPWTQPQDVDIQAHPALNDPGGFSSHHTGGVQFLMGDGSVRFISEEINQQTLDSLYGKSDANPIPNF